MNLIDHTKKSRTIMNMEIVTLNVENKLIFTIYNSGNYKKLMFHGMINCYKMFKFI